MIYWSKHAKAPGGHSARTSRLTGTETGWAAGAAEAMVAKIERKRIEKFMVIVVSIVYDT